METRMEVARHGGTDIAGLMNGIGRAARVASRALALAPAAAKQAALHAGAAAIRADAAAILAANAADVASAQERGTRGAFVDRLVLDSESIDCRPGHASRIGSVDNRVVVQTLNPGGLITPANRLDHLIWWATCAPDQAGRDPELLTPVARRLGFDGQQQESLIVLPGQAQPHP
jgi:2-hydroxychromene-2-carboxylate isomerase